MNVKQAELLSHVLKIHCKQQLEYEFLSTDVWSCGIA
jgi:hypothetical protein